MAWGCSGETRVLITAIAGPGRLMPGEHEVKPLLERTKTIRQ